MARKLTPQTTQILLTMTGTDWSGPNMPPATVTDLVRVRDFCNRLAQDMAYPACEDYMLQTIRLARIVGRPDDWEHDATEIADYLNADPA